MCQAAVDEHPLLAGHLEPGEDLAFQLLAAGVEPRGGSRVQLLVVGLLESDDPDAAGQPARPALVEVGADDG